MAKLVLMLRVKDGLFYINQWLERYEHLVDEIVALDNGSTDGTYEILTAHPKVVEVVRTKGFNEGRDKNLLYSHVRKRNPDWCLWLDVDEIFETELSRAHLDKMMRSSLVDRYAFRRFHFIDNEYFAGSWYWLNYSSGHDRMMWREKPSGYFPDLVIDSPNVKGIDGIKAYTTYRIKHLGYINTSIVAQKASLYRSIIPESEDVIQSMYIANEKRIKWVDKRNSLSVILVNNLLTCIQASHLYHKALNYIGRIFPGSGRPIASPTISATTEKKFSKN